MRGRPESWRDISVCFCLLPVLPSRVLCARLTRPTYAVTSCSIRGTSPALKPAAQSQHPTRGGKPNAKRSPEPKTEALTKTGRNPRQFAAAQPRRRGQGTVGLLYKAQSSRSKKQKRDSRQRQSSLA